MKVVVVEDNPINLELMTDLLEAHGIEVVGASDAAEAIRATTTHLPDLVLMDISLPGMDGLQATRALKEQAVTAHIPVIAVTAHAHAQDHERAMEAGCAGTITKPINVRGFVAEISEYVSPDRRPASE